MRRAGPWPTPRQCGQIERCQIGTQVSAKGVLTRSTDAVTSLFESRVRPARDPCKTGTKPARDPLDLDAEPLRPLARRARMTLRPPRVFIRTKKPWVRLRRVTEGWNVRFIGVASQAIGKKPSITAVLELLVKWFLQIPANKLWITRLRPRYNQTPACTLSLIHI